MRWIALTGVNGFIGHNLALEFLEKRPQTLALEIDKVLGADLETSLDRPLHRVKLKAPGYQFRPAEKMIGALVEQETAWGGPPVAVLHNGACSSTTETNPEVFRKLNVESSRELFDYCADRKIPYLYASSASVYGDGSRGFSDAPEKNSDYRPLNLYGRSKHEFDAWVLAQERRPPGWFGMRYFNVFGPHEEHKGSQASLLHWGARQIRETGRLRLYRSHREDIADGEQKRDFVSVFDVVRVTVELLRSALEGTELPLRGCFVNVGRGEACSWIDAGTALFTAMGRPTNIEFVDMPAQLRAHYQNFTRADLSTLHSLGLTQPFLTLEEGFSQSLQEMAAADATPPR